MEESRKHQVKSNELRLKGDLDEALVEQKKAVEITPNDADALKILGSIYNQIYRETKQNTLEEAKQAFEKAVKINPNNALAHSQLADVLDQMGGSDNVKRALAELKEAIRLESNNASYLNSLGALYGENNDKKSEKQCYEKALEINPNYESAIYNLALAEKDAGNYDKAIELFKRSMELDKDNVETTKQRIQEVEALKSLAKKKP